MRFRRKVNLRAVCCLIGMIALGVTGSAVAQGPEADRWGQLATANNLDHDGNTPFHVKVAFQLYDLEGKPVETGTVEEWWAPHKFKRVITSPSLNDDGSSAGGGEPAVVREKILVDRLLDTVVHPVPRLAMQNVEKLNEGSRTFGKASLDCVTPETVKKVSRFLNVVTLCTEPKSDELRAVLGSEGEAMVVRNSIGKFHDTYMGVEVQMSLVGRYAITGKVATLQSIDPAKSAELSQEDKGAASSENSNRPNLPGEVTAGFRMKFVQPQYPEAAKMEHKSGIVVMNAIISKEGLVTRLVPIAVSDPVFTDEAVKAVRQWTYSPYLLNGEPTEVDTTITVNFVLNRN
jgi:TonB family protein